MIHLTHSVTVAASLATVWQRLADLEWLATVNEFHRAARFQTEQRSGVGTRLIAEHGFPWLPVTYPRIIRLTHWEPSVRLGWAEFDARFPKWLFPHSTQYRMAPLDECTTQLAYELRGSIRPRILERLVEISVVRAVVERECQSIKARVEYGGTGNQRIERR